MNNKSKKYKSAILIAGLVILGAVIITPSAQSRTKPYFSGEAISYYDKIFFATANTGVVELFQVVDNSIIKMNIITSDDTGNQKFLDVIFKQENGGLYLYAVNGQYLYKYHIDGSGSFTLLDKKKDNVGDWFYGLNKTKDGIMTIGTKGIKIWNKDLLVTTLFTDKIKDQEGVSFSANDNYIINTNSGQLRLTDAFYRDNILTVNLDTIDAHGRSSYSDANDGAIYVVDDSYLRKFYLEGESVKFNHTGNFGYDVSGLDNKSYVYFSDGIGVVKNRKSDLKPIDWVYTANLGAGSGWATGLRTVASSWREYVLVFNGTSILLMDSELNLLDTYNAHDAEECLVQPLYLNISQNWGFANGNVRIAGGGFNLDEGLDIYFAGQKTYAQTDQSGQFQQTLTIPAVKPGQYDIKVNGKKSGLSYSISFTIK